MVESYYVIRDEQGYYLKPSVGFEPQRGYVRTNRIFTYDSMESCLAYFSWWKAMHPTNPNASYDINDFNVYRVDFTKV